MQRVWVGSSQGRFNTRSELSASTGQSRLCFLAPTDFSGRPELAAPSGQTEPTVVRPELVAPTGRSRLCFLAPTGVIAPTEPTCTFRRLYLIAV